MEISGIVLLLLVGIIAGWIAGLITKGRGFGLIRNMVIGVIGAFIGRYLFAYFGLVAHGILGLLIASVVGAVALIIIVGVIRKLAS